MRAMICIGLLALLGACTQAQAIGEQQLIDLGRFLDQNHGQRYEIRAMTHDAVKNAANVCMFQTEDAFACDAAIARADKVIDFLQRNYPELVTIQAIDAGRARLNELRGAEPETPAR